MAWLMTIIRGRHKGEDENIYGESLTRPFDGAEIGLFRELPDIWAAVATAEMRDWLVGVHYPLLAPKSPFTMPPLTAVARETRREAFALAEQGARDAKAVGARYVLFHLPFPALVRQGLDLTLWRHPVPPEQLEEVGEPAVRAAVREALAAMLELQEQVGIEVVLELDGPSPLLYEADLLGELMPEFPGLSLCLDTSRLNCLARIHGHPPDQLAARWLPWTRHLHLSECKIHGSEKEEHLPARPDLHPAEGWTGAAEIAAAVVARHPRCRIVLEHDARKVSPEQLEAAHSWARSLAKG